MTDDAQRYKLADAERQQRLNEFEGAEDPPDLRHELSLAREMLESSRNANATGTSVALLGTVGKLATAFRLIQERNNEYIHRRELAQLGRALCQAVVEELQVLPGWEAIADRIYTRVGNVYAHLKNNLEPKRLEAPK